MTINDDGLIDYHAGYFDFNLSRAGLGSGPFDILNGTSVNLASFSKVFGLNRAIFYAWAKKRRTSLGASTKRIQAIIEGGKKPGELMEERIGDEVAFRVPNGFFEIGGQVQRPAGFNKQVATRFGKYFDQY